MPHPLAFRKMHGLGNDFVVLDSRNTPINLSKSQIALIADRHFGVGCDQLIILEKSQSADLFMRIYNPDASESEACGNATRCIAWLIAREQNKTVVSIDTKAGLLTAQVQGTAVTVDMGAPKFDWQEIPVTRRCETLKMPYGRGGLTNPSGVNMGNPHAVFIVPSVDAIALETLGPEIERDPFFPERVNVSVAEILDRKTIRLRVWERGAGLTSACGTAACATAVTAIRRDLADSPVTVQLPGGDLQIAWKGKTSPVIMTGPVSESFSGVLSMDLLEVLPPSTI